MDGIHSQWTGICLVSGLLPFYILKLHKSKGAAQGNHRLFIILGDWSVLIDKDLQKTKKTKKTRQPTVINQLTNQYVCLRVCMYACVRMCVCLNKLLRPVDCLLQLSKLNSPKKKNQTNKRVSDGTRTDGPR